MHRFSHTRFTTVVLVIAGTIALISCSANRPSDIETMVAQEAKKMAISGKDLPNPIPDTPENVKEGAEHFQHHCQICHGLDGHNTGVPFADKMSPEIADLGANNVQNYTNGQLKMIIEKGIRFSGMPGWKGILTDDEMWRMVRYIRHLPPKGSLGAPAIYREAESEHHHLEKTGQPQHTHTHSPHE